MGEGFFGWRKKEGEKREFVDAQTKEPAEMFVTDDKGNVIGHAATEAEAKQVAADAGEHFREAA
ncbi:MAG: hypothetical protein V4681_03425 [Patescibacteria group bacterium]